jgi:hypothetical protein
VFDRYNVVSEGDLHEAARKMAKHSESVDLLITHSLTHSGEQAEESSAIPSNILPN